MNRVRLRTKSVVILPKLIELALAHNRGGAWSLLADQPASVRLPFFFGSVVEAV